MCCRELAARHPGRLGWNSDVGMREATVGVLGTGGTIQNTMSGRISVGSLIEEVVASNDGDGPALPRLVHDDVYTVGSEDLKPADWAVIARRAQELATDREVGGVVVTHGTYTAEETAYFLHLCVRTEKPIVVTCSQRRHRVVGNDGDRNLVDAIRVAASDRARKLGCVLVVGEEIHSSREVTKTSQRPGGFNSGFLGPLGSVEADTVSVYRMPARRHTYRSELSARSLPDALPTVEIVETYPGAGAQALLGAVESGAQGVVVNGYTPSGWPTREQREILDELVPNSGVPIVVVGRGRWGRVPKSSDAVPWITGDNLSAYKARILLMLAIATSFPSSSLQRLYDEY